MNDAMLDVLRVAAPVTNLGYGRRVVLWVAGCSIGCAKCCSQDTWAARGHTLSVSEVSRLIDALASRHAGLCGLTVSGGEPTESAPAVLSLLERVRSVHADWDILLYSGLAWRKLRALHADLLGLCDAVVPEPFVHGLPSEHVLLGSRNQSIKRLTPLGDQRYTQLDAKKSALEATVSDNIIAFSGVPKGDSLDRFAAALQRRGIRLATKSWS